MELLGEGPRTSYDEINLRSTSVHDKHGVALPSVLSGVLDTSAEDRTVGVLTTCNWVDSGG